ncbi:cell division protein FtsK [Siminovitchia terrae]|uniref:YpjP family protein n=1 Tax=Siminovitchia terrae TaxID=1914933 RepID=UPI001B06B579|nr:YpjP family protein [Siminovitchia terrae]GIN90357.1 cell division protein FtsK [Siminovitchia terrae]
MKLWLRKISVFLVAIITLGLYIPSVDSNITINEDKEIYSPKRNIREAENDTLLGSDTKAKEDSVFPDNPIDIFTSKAKEQAIVKMGPRILQQVEDDFTSMILPAMEEVLTLMLVEAGQDQVAYYTITEQPAGGYGEKIFHLYDSRNQKDVARFHVRREKRPLEGHWFNFHYHLSNDHFEEHHEIGEIYWSKDDPPKWMT